MNIRFFSLLCTSVVLTSCIPLDPLDRAAYEADHAGSISAKSHDGSNPLNSAFRVVETLYYSKKYPGSPEQIQRALNQGRELSAKWQRRAESSTPHLGNQSTPSSQSATHQPPPKYMLISIGKSPTSGDTKTMLFDTVAQHLVGNNVYEFPKTPKKDTQVRFETYTAQYVGTGID